MAMYGQDKPAQHFYQEPIRLTALSNAGIASVLIFT
jgi:hypothetical protein